MQTFHVTVILISHNVWRLTTLFVCEEKWERERERNVREFVLWLSIKGILLPTFLFCTYAWSCLHLHYSTGGQYIEANVLWFASLTLPSSTGQDMRFILFFFFFLFFLFRLSFGECGGWWDFYCNISCINLLHCLYSSEFFLLLSLGYFFFLSLLFEIKQTLDQLLVHAGVTYSLYSTSKIKNTSQSASILWLPCIIKVAKIHTLSGECLELNLQTNFLPIEE